MNKVISLSPASYENKVCGQCSAIGKWCSVIEDVDNYVILVCDCGNELRVEGVEDGKENFI